MGGSAAELDVLRRLLGKYEQDPEFVAEALAVDVTEQALALLSMRRLTRTSLADRMGVSRARVSRIFNAPPNLTLLSIAQIATALEVRPSIALDGGQVPSRAPANDFEDQRTDAAIATTVGLSGTANATSTGGRYPRETTVEAPGNAATA